MAVALREQLQLLLDSVLRHSLIDWRDELGAKLGNPRREQLLEFFEVGPDAEHRHGGVVTGDRVKSSLHRRDQAAVLRASQ